LSLSAPAATWPKGVRALPLEGFPEVSFGALWMGKLSAMGELFVNEAEALAAKLMVGR
jgi:hypothetical protein